MPYILHISKKDTVSWFLMSGIQQGGLYKVTALYNCWNDMTKLHRRKFCKVQMFALFTIECQCAKTWTCIIVPENILPPRLASYVSLLLLPSPLVPLSMAVSPASIKAVNKEVSKRLQNSTPCAQLTGTCSQDLEQTTSIGCHSSKELESRSQEEQHSSVEDKIPGSCILKVRNWWEWWYLCKAYAF